MNVQEVKELMQTMAQTGVTSLDWNSCGAAVHLEMMSAGQTSSDMNSQTNESQTELPYLANAQSSENRDTSSTTAADASESAEKDQDLPGELVKSPVVGVFYSSPSPDSEPFVRQGGYIEKGKPLCIIEAMKLMNEVSSPASGEIAEVMVEDGQRVEFGQPLFRIV